MEITSTELINKAERQLIDLVKGAFNSGKGFTTDRIEQCKKYVDIINFIEDEEMEEHEEDECFEGVYKI